MTTEKNSVLKEIEEFEIELNKFKNCIEIHTSRYRLSEKELHDENICPDSLYQKGTNLAVSTKNNAAQEAVDALFTAMREELIKGNQIEVRGFGVLEVKEAKAKPAARNPRTGEVVYVPPRRKTHFKPGKELKEALHKPLEP